MFLKNVFLLKAAFTWLISLQNLSDFWNFKLFSNVNITGCEMSFVLNVQLILSSTLFFFHPQNPLISSLVVHSLPPHSLSLLLWNSQSVRILSPFSLYSLSLIKM